ncbi:MAG: methyltransferase [Desulforhopalus sp.]
MSNLRYTDVDDTISRDSLFDGDLICFQRQNGYRYSIDSVLVAHFVAVRQNDRILDLGTGIGIISLILMYRWRDRIREIVGIEVQDGLAELARKNFHINKMENKSRILQGDVKEIKTMIEPESYDRVVCNPPFYSETSGRISKNQEARLARHQICASLEDFLRASSFAVKNGGTVTCVYPAETIAELIIIAQRNRLEVKKLQFIYSYPHKTATARLVLIQCLKNGGVGTEILPPFYIYYEKNGGYSAEMQELYKRNNEFPLISDH